MQRPFAANIILTASLAFVLGYFGLDKLIHPNIWIGWIPLWMQGFLGLSIGNWLIVIGLAELLMAILLVIPVRSVRRIGTVIIALHLLAVLTQVGWNDIAIRDIGLLGASLALLFLL